MNKRRFIAGLLLVVPSVLFAQAQGRIKGIVSDSKGAPIPKAKIVMTCPEIANFNREVVADEKGRFATLIVDATKVYKFHVEAPGYQAFERTAKPLIGGQTLELDFTLQSVADVQAAQQKKALEEPGIKQLRDAQDLLEAGKTVEARAKFAEAVAARPDLYVAWLAIGDIDQKAGRNDDAIAAAEKYLALKPEFPQCLALGMNATQGKGDKEAYEKFRERYKATNPSDPSVFYNDAVGFLNKNDDAKALPLLEKALEADPKYADAMFQLGMVYFRTGDAAKAKAMFQRFLDTAPNHREAPTAKEMLKYL